MNAKEMAQKKTIMPETLMDMGGMFQTEQTYDDILSEAMQDRYAL